MPVKAQKQGCHSFKKLEGKHNEGAWNNEGAWYNEGFWFFFIFSGLVKLIILMLYFFIQTYQSSFNFENWQIKKVFSNFGQQNFWLLLKL